MDRDILKNKLYVSWDIHVNCNYRCPYCFFEGEWEEHKRKNIYLPMDEWIKCWNKIYKEYGSAHIDISGGEPFIYPSFLELIFHLSKIHSLGIITNLSWDVKSFIGKIAPDRVKLHPSFHPYFTESKSFLAKLIILRNNGFEIGASCVGYPPLLKNILKYKEEFESVGIAFSLLPFSGVYNGINYPQGYTFQEKELIAAVLNDPTAKGYTLERKPTKGKLCSAGYTYIRIRPEGSTYRCAHSKTIGNIMDADFKLLDKPAPCDSEYCDCLNELIYIVDQ